MAVTSAGDLDGVLTAAAALNATITGINSSWKTTPTIGPDDALTIPAAMHHISADDLEPSTVEYDASKEIVNHHYILDILIQRTNDLQADAGAAMAFVPKVLAAYRGNITLGETPIVHRVLPQSFRFVTVTLGQETYYAVRFRMQAHCKQAVTIT